MSAMFDHTLTIQAPLHLVWQEARKFAQRGKIIIERLDQLLVATQLKFGYVYWLQENPDGSTNLRVFIDQAEQVEEMLKIKADIPAALAEISSHEQSAGSELLNAGFGIFFQQGSPQFNGGTALEQTKKKAEQEAKKAHWAPHPAIGFDRSPAIQSVPVTSEIIQPKAVVPGQAPFSPYTLIAISAFFNFGAAGVVAGLNWKRLGKPERMWPTIVISLAGLFALLTASFTWPVVQKLLDELQLAFYGALGTFLCIWQYPHFARWVNTYGKPKTGVRGFFTVLGLSVGIMLAALVYLFGLSIIQEILAAGF